MITEIITFENVGCYYTESLNDPYNKHFEILPLYYGRPFIYNWSGRDPETKKIISPPSLVRGQCVFFHKNLIGMVWYNPNGNGEYITECYKEIDFYTKIPLCYGYLEGDTVKRVTDGELFTIKRINWIPGNLWVMTEEDGNAKLSYSLYIPQRSDKNMEFDPMEEGYWKGVFYID